MPTAYTQYPIQGISQNASGFRPYVVIPCIGYNPYEVTYLIRLQGLFLVSGFLVLDTTCNDHMSSENEERAMEEMIMLTSCVFVDTSAMKAERRVTFFIHSI